MIETVKRPYEFLIRWREGNVQGAHVGFELTTTEDGKVLSTTALPVMPVDIGQGIGFPLADILAQIHIDALIQMDVANTESAKDKASIVERDASIATLTAKVVELGKVAITPQLVKDAPALDI